MKKPKRFLKFIKIFILFVVALSVLTAGVVCVCRLVVKSTDFNIIYQGELESASGYDYIIVPGAGIKMSRPGTRLCDRLDTAITLYQNGAADKIIVSGGFDENSKLYESKVMQIYLKNAGIPKRDIICDDYGIDTAETLRRAKTIIGSEKAIICTQSIYADRTAFLAEKYDISASIADSDIHIYTSEVGRARLRETFAATKAVYDGNFAKKCRYSTKMYPFTGGTSDE